MNIEWDARAYKADFAYVTQFGVAALSLIDAKAGARVLDLGCGAGTLTALLTERGFTAIGADSSPEMLELARSAYPDIPFIEADACNFTLEKPVDVVFSNSVLHWIEEERQKDVFTCVAAALKPGGQFVFECGGEGCIAGIHTALDAAFAAHELAYAMPFHYPTEEECQKKLEAAGLIVTHAAVLEPRPKIKREDGMKGYIHMFLKRPFEGLDETTCEQIIDDAVRRGHESPIYRAGTWTPDYVRLRMRAIKPAL